MPTPFEELAELGRETAQGTTVVGPMPTNTHVHLPPNFSAFDDMDDALDLAKKEGIVVLGGSNYYDYSVYSTFVEGALKRGIYPVLGAEILSWMADLAATGTLINDPGNPGKAYLVAKSLARIADPPASARKTLDGIRARDTERMRLMVDKLEAVFSRSGVSTGLDAAKVIERVAARHRVPKETVVLQERHAAQAFQERLFEEVEPGRRAEVLGRLFSGESPSSVASLRTAEASEQASNPLKVQGDIRTHLIKAGKPAYVEEQFIAYDEAVRLVLELGGLPCYTAVADGIKPITPFEATPEKLIENIQAKGIYVTEFIPNRNSVEVMEEYVLKMRRAGLVVSAGTEHNTLDRIPLTPACLKQTPIPERIAAIFWEGACVVVGHQAEVMAGRRGYLDPDDKPTSEYNDPEMRIAKYKAHGEAAIAQTIKAAR